MQASAWDALHQAYVVWVGQDEVAVSDVVDLAVAEVDHLQVLPVLPPRLQLYVAQADQDEAVVWDAVDLAAAEEGLSDLPSSLSRSVLCLVA